MLGIIKVHHPSCIIEFSQFRFQDIHRFSRLSSGFEAHERSRLKVGAIATTCYVTVNDGFYMFYGGNNPRNTLSTCGKSPVSKVNHLLVGYGHFE